MKIIVIVEEGRVTEVQGLPKESTLEVWDYDVSDESADDVIKPQQGKPYILYTL